MTQCQQEQNEQAPAALSRPWQDKQMHGFVCEAEVLIQSR
jgi:hypothetical protein